MRELKIKVDDLLYVCVEGGLTVNIYLDDECVDMYNVNEKISDYNDLDYYVTRFRCVNNIYNKINDDLIKEVGEKAAEHIIELLEDLNDYKKFKILADYVKLEHNYHFLIRFIDIYGDYFDMKYLGEIVD